MPFLHNNLRRTLPLAALVSVVVLSSSLSSGATTTSHTPTTVKTTTTLSTTTTTTTTTTTSTSTTTTSTLPPRTLVGLATYYRPPAKGVYFGPSVVCATTTAIPLRAKVRITNLANGKVATCMVGDRKGPSQVRIIDLNDTVFQRLAPLAQGVIRVKLTW